MTTKNLQNSLETTAGDQKENLQARLIWSHIAEPGDNTAHTLREKFGPAKALNLVLGSRGNFMQKAHEQTTDTLTERQLQAAWKRWEPRLQTLQKNAQHTIQEDLRTAEEHQLTLITPEQENWPPSLQDLGESTPNLIWARGKISTLKTPAVAIVGTRCSSNYAETITCELSQAITAKNACILSGGAFGIDATAHRAALAGNGTTIAVLAGGIINAYPRAHTQLFKQIAETGCLITEMPGASTPTKWRFLQRNRLIACLTKATIVTEASTRSGALNTAGHAATIGRPIGAVPGPVTNPEHAGCHKLIREYGAELITNAQQALELAEIRDETPKQVTQDRPSSLHVRVLDALSAKHPIQNSTIAQKTGISIEQTQNILAELELLGKTKRTTGQNTGQTRWLLQRAK